MSSAPAIDKKDARIAQVPDEHRRQFVFQIEGEEDLVVEVKDVMSSLIENNGVWYYHGREIPVQVGDQVELYVFPDPYGNRLYQMLPHASRTQDQAPEDFPEDEAQPIYVPEDDLTFQIGTVHLLVPPVFIRVERIANTHYVPTLRSGGSIKRNIGKADTQISLELIFPNLDAINDPDNGLRALIALFRRAPFVPVYNRHLNLNEGIRAVVLHDLQITTVQGFPEALQVSLVMFKFNWSVYMPDEEDFGAAIDEKLFRWYIRRGLLEDHPSSSRRRKRFLDDYRLEDSALSFSAATPESLEQAYQQAKRSRHLRSALLDASEFAEILPRARQDLETIQEVFDAMASGNTEASHPFFQILKRTHRDPATRKPMVIDYIVRVHVDSKAIAERDPHPWRDLQPWADTGGFTERDGAKLHLLFDANRVPYAQTQEFFEWVKQYVAELETHLQDSQDRVREIEEALTVKPYETEVWDPVGTWTVVGMTVGVQNIVARVPIQGSVDPVYQFLGSRDHRAQIHLETDEAGLESLRRLFEYCQTTARHYYSRLMTGFLGIHSPLTRMMGIEHVIIEAMVSQSIPGFPGRFQVELTLVDYDRMQRARSKGVFITQDEDREFVIRRAPDQEIPGYVVYGAPDPASGQRYLEWARVEDVLSTLDCYPDLDLPTYQELAEFLGVQDYTTLPYYHGGAFVDPDFYMRYKHLDTPEDLVMISEGSSLSLRDNLGHYIESVRLGQDRLHERMEELYQQDPPVDEPEDVDIADVNDEELPENQIFRETVGDDLDAYQMQKPVEELFYGAFHDYLHHSARGRLLRAFPTFYMFVIDEGKWIRWVRLWDNFYGFNAIGGIEVHNSRKLAAQTCHIELANVDHFIASVSTSFRYRGQSWTFNWRDFWFLSVDEKDLKARAQAPNRIFLMPGARLHLRLGYGNNLSQLPIVFNGTITESQMGETLRLIALSDAWELSNPMNYRPHELPSMNPSGMRPRDLLLQLLTVGDRRGIVDTIGMAIENIFERQPFPPAVHFGDPDIKLGFIRRAGEIGQNIYPGIHIGKHKSVNPFTMAHSGEMRVPVDMYGKSIFDVGQILAAATPNFIFTTHPFEFRSTVFFGKPHWEFAYGYEVDQGDPFTREWYEAFLKVEDRIRRYEKDPLVSEWLMPYGGWDSEAMRQKALEDLGNHDRIKLRWRPTKGGYWVREKRKPFSQWHIYTSVDDIVSNEIRISIRDLYTSVLATYDEDYSWGLRPKMDQAAPIAVQLDPYIYPQFQRAMSVHSELVAHQLGVLTFNIPFLGRPLGMMYHAAFTRSLARNVAASTLRDSLKDLYQGELIVLGDPTVKPYDKMYLADLQREMFGTCGVKEVSHHLSLETGFITVISPDVEAAIKDAEIVDLTPQYNTAWMLALGMVFRSSIASLLQGMQQRAGSYWRTAWRAASQSAQVQAGRTALNALIRRLGALAARAAPRLIGQAAVRAAATAAAQAAAATVGSLLVVKGPLLLLLSPVIILGFYALNESFRRSWTSRDLIACNFLTLKGMPFVGGLHGYRKITVGAPSEVFDASSWNILQEWLWLSDIPERKQPAENLWEYWSHLFVDPVVLSSAGLPWETQQLLMQLPSPERDYARIALNSDSPLLRAAVEYLLTPYQPGGRDKSGIDPIGLLRAVLHDAGLMLTDEAIEQMMQDPRRFVTSDHLGSSLFEHAAPFQIGDIVFFDRDRDHQFGGRFDQVGIMINPDQGLVLLVNDKPTPEHPTRVMIVDWRDLYAGTASDSPFPAHRQPFLFGLRLKE